MSRKIGIVLLIIACLLGSAAVGRWVAVSPLLFLLFAAIVVLLLIFLLETRLDPAEIIGLVIIFSVVFPPIPTPLEKLAIKGGDVLLLVALLAYVLPAFLFRVRGSVAVKSTDRVPLVLFSMMVLITISVLWGIARYDIVPIRGDFFEYVKVVQYFVAYWLASQIRLDMRRLDKLISLLCASTIISLIVAWLQITDVVPGVTDALATLYQFGKDPTLALRSAGQRAVGTLGNANNYASFIAVVASVSFAQLLFRADLSRTRRRLHTIFVMASIVSIGITASRTAAAALTVAVLFLTMSKNRASWSKPDRRFWWLLVLAGIAAVSYWYILPKVAPFAARRWALTSEVEQYSTLNGRIFIWQKVVPLIKQSPLFGYGPAESRLSSAVDNEFLAVALHYGLVGLAVYVLLWWHLYAKGRSLIVSGDSARIAFGRGLQAMVVTCLVFALGAGAFYLITQMTVVFILGGLAQSLLRQREDIITRQQPSPSTIGYVRGC